MSKPRRRSRPAGTTSPSEQREAKRLRLYMEESERRNTCSKNPYGFHEESPIESETLTFTRDGAPTVCRHCGRRGALVILELDVKWEDPLVDDTIDGRERG